MITKISLRFLDDEVKKGGPGLESRLPRSRSLRAKSRVEAVVAGGVTRRDGMRKTAR